MVLTNTDISNYVAQCHQASLDAGWYTNISTGEPLSRNIPEMLALIHSELSEAYEFYITGENDDKLHHLPGFAVEIADTLIRIFDMCGYLKLKPRIMPTHIKDYESYFNKASNNSTPIEKYLCFAHLEVSNTLESIRKSQSKETTHLSSLITQLVTICDKEEIDIKSIIDQKLAFNASRADHKISNRSKSGGKKF